MDPQIGMRAAELGEAAFMRQMFAAADTTSRAALGMTQADIGGGVVTLMTADPTGGFWSRAIGFGITEPLTAAVIDEAFAFARDHHAPGLIFQVAPQVPGDWETLLEARGARRSAAWVKFAGPATLTPPVRTDLRIETVAPHDGAAYAEVICRGFGMPQASGLPGWFAGLPGWGEHGFTAYGAFDGDTMVAAASLFVADGVATLAGAATLPEHRGRGAQGALMARRIHDAARLGCDYVTAETGTETPERPNPSLHNMRRIGLTELYNRYNWVWHHATA